MAARVFLRPFETKCSLFSRLLSLSIPSAWRRRGPRCRGPRCRGAVPAGSGRGGWQRAQSAAGPTAGAPPPSRPPYWWSTPQPRTIFLGGVRLGILKKLTTPLLKTRNPQLLYCGTLSCMITVAHMQVCHSIVAHLHDSKLHGGPRQFRPINRSSSTCHTVKSQTIVRTSIRPSASCMRWRSTPTPVSASVRQRLAVPTVGVLRLHRWPASGRHRQNILEIGLAQHAWRCPAAGRGHGRPIIAHLSTCEV